MEEKKMKKVTESEQIPEFQESIKNMPENIKQKVDAKLKAITDTCTLTDFELVQACEKWIDRLCKSGGDAWTLEVPVNMNRDPDMLFTELIRRFSNPQPGAEWVKGAPKERKQYFAKVTSQIEDNLFHDAIIWPTQRAAHWYAAGNGFNFVVHDNEVIAYLAESGTPAAAMEEDWISVEDRLPEEGGRYWCYVQHLTDLGFSYFQWNCDYNPQLRRFSDMTPSFAGSRI